MALEDNKTIVRRFIEECVKQGNMEVFDTFFAPHLAVHFYGGPPHSHASYRALVQQIHQAFSDHSSTIQDLVAESDKVVARVSSTAIHRGQFEKCGRGDVV